MKNRLFLLTALFFFFCSSSLFAWGYHTHRKLTAEAFKNMPEAFQARFSKQKKSFLQGCTDPDIMIKDFMNHIYYPDGTQTGGLYRIQDLFNRSVELLSSGENDEKTAYVMGLMSHYIADLNVPLHTAGSERDPDESSYHSSYESDINHNLRNFKFSFDQERPVSSIEERVKEMTTAALRHYDEIGASYRAGSNLNPLMAMTEKQLNAAMQNIVDFWCAVLRSAKFDLNNRQAMQPDWTVQAPAKNEPEKININAASVIELADFFKISQAKAQNIVDSRPYRSAYDLAKTGIFNPMYIKRHKDRIKTR